MSRVPFEVNFYYVTSFVVLTGLIVGLGFKLMEYGPSYLARAIWMPGFPTTIAALAIYRYASYVRRQFGDL